MRVMLEETVGVLTYKRHPGDVMAGLRAVINVVDGLSAKVQKSGAVPSTLRATVNFSGDGKAIIFVEGVTEGGA